jgi:hypothetical protein
MRHLGFRLFSDRVSMSEPRLPAPSPPQARQSLRRRLEDQVETLYTKACINNDLEAASDLLALLENWFARRSAKFGRERRRGAVALQRARRELEQLTSARQSKR